MRLSLAVQHHPKRADLLQALVSSLTPLPPQVIRDPDPDASPCPWRTYRAALETTPAWATHRIVLQDDARVCRNFPTVLKAVVAARPDTVIALCVCGVPRYSAQQMHRAAADGIRWTHLRRNDWIPVIGVVWPSRIIRPALEWVEAQGWPRCIADDAVVGRAVRGLGEEVWACVPSIVQHDDLVPSLTSKRARGGKDPGRVAALFAEDATGIDWAV